MQRAPVYVLIGAAAACFVVASFHESRDRQKAVFWNRLFVILALVILAIILVALKQDGF